MTSADDMVPEIHCDIWTRITRADEVLVFANVIVAFAAIGYLIGTTAILTTLMVIFGPQIVIPSEVWSRITNPTFTQARFLLAITTTVWLVGTNNVLLLAGILSTLAMIIYRYLVYRFSSEEEEDVTGLGKDHSTQEFSKSDARPSRATIGPPRAGNPDMVNELPEMNNPLEDYLKQTNWHGVASCKRRGTNCACCGKKFKLGDKMYPMPE